MSWVGLRIRFSTAFSYRWPEAAGMALPLPGPSALRLALVGAARERAKQTGPRREPEVAEEVLSVVRGAPLLVELPPRVVLWTATMRRLAAQGGPRPGTRRDALPREYASPAGPYSVWLDLPDEPAAGVVRAVAPWIRSLGTRDSLCLAEPVDPGAEPDLPAAAGEAAGTTGSADEGTLVELRDLRKDVTSAELMAAKTDPYVPVLWALPGVFRPLDEHARVFDRTGWARPAAVLAHGGAR